MARSKHLVVAGWLLAFAGIETAAQAPLRESFDLSVPVPPTPVAVEGRARLFYELHLANFSRQPLDPVRVEVFDAASGRIVATFEGDALAKQLDRSGLQWGADKLDAIAPGRRGIVFFELAFAPGAAVPRLLEHRIHYRADSDVASTHQVEGARVAVATDAPPAIAPPLRGGPWIAIYDPAWTRGHRRVAYAVDGKARTPGRFAIDWVKLDARGRKAEMQGDRAADAYSHGEDVLAVTDGVVAGARNDLPERTRTSERAEHSLETGAGNFVSLDIGGGRFAFYGHLRPGSVRVAPGQRVRRGEKIAEIGFTGSASDPQLHFHLADAPTALGGEGLPFVIDRFESLGGYAEIAGVGRQAWTPHADGSTAPRERELPAGNSVVRFGAGKPR